MKYAKSALFFLTFSLACNTSHAFPQLDQNLSSIPLTTASGKEETTCTSDDVKEVDECEVAHQKRMRVCNLKHQQAQLLCSDAAADCIDSCIVPWPIIAVCRATCRTNESVCLNNAGRDFSYCATFSTREQIDCILAAAGRCRVDISRIIESTK